MGKLKSGMVKELTWGLGVKKRCWIQHARSLCLTSESITTRLQCLFLHVCVHTQAETPLPPRHFLRSSLAPLPTWTILTYTASGCFSFLLGFTARKTIPGRGPLRVRQVEMEVCPWSLSWLQDEEIDPRRERKQWGWSSGCLEFKSEEVRVCLTWSAEPPNGLLMGAEF